MKTQSAIAILSLLLISSACPGSGPDNRPDFNTTYPDVYELSLGIPNLSYDLNPFLNYYRIYVNKYPASDLQEMIDHHGIYSSGHTISFLNLLREGDSAPGAEVRFIFTEPNCSNSKEIIYNSYDYDLCNRNVIKNAPKVTTTHAIDFSAKTIKTTDSQLQIKWYKQLILSGNDAIYIDQKGTLNFYKPYYTKSTGSNVIGGRPNNNGGYDYIPNTTGSLTTGTYEQGPIVSLVEVPPVLTQNVCYDGEISPAMSWDIPVEIMLIPE